MEALAIRFLHVLHALNPKRRPGLCPPACSEGHTYRWPCRVRAHKDHPLGSLSFGFNVRTKDVFADPRDMIEEIHEGYRRDPSH